MATHVRLLPRSATPFELAMAEANDPWAALADTFNAIPVADGNPPPALLPFLVWEYGLGELSPYVPNLYALISQGVRWQRIRGTPASIQSALGFVGYGGSIEEEPPRRLLWNRVQVNLSRICAADVPDLEQIDGVVSLSLPARSNFWRGYRTWDVRAAETSYQRFGMSALSDHSGIRLREDGAQWSFGRETAISYELTQSELTALGCWSVPAATLGPWSAMNVPWTGATFPWFDGYAQTRRNAILAALSVHPSYVVFRDAANAVIGFSLATIRGVNYATTGDYQIAGSLLAVSSTPAKGLIFCRTPFSAADGAVVAAVGLAFNPTLRAGIKPGALWVGPNDITAATYVGQSPVAITMAATIREHVAFVLDLDTH